MPLNQPYLLFRSAPAKLGFVALLFVAAVMAVHSLSLGSLANVDLASSEIRNRWLESIQILGNLRHHVARVRASEAEYLLAEGQEKPTDVQDHVDLAVDDIAAYRAINHDPDETKPFDIFVADWQAHLQQQEALVRLVSNGKTADAIGLFKGEASSTFRKAARELRQLVDLTHQKAQAARAHGRDAVSGAQQFISNLILAMLALFAGLAVYLWWSFSRPLLQLADFMNRLSLNDTSFNIPLLNRRDEIGTMARSLAVLRRNTIELLETRKTLAMEANVLSATLEKEQAFAAAQRNFLTTMSHEFRTPLTYIDGHAQRLIATRGQATSEQITERASKIRSAVFQMTSLVASLTAEMEMLNAPGEARKRTFDPAAMLRDLIGYYEKIDLKVRFEEHLGTLPQIVGDREFLRRAFSNLLSNAIKYSPEGGAVEISGRTLNNSLVISVADHGIGIPANELQQVLEPFYRGSNAGTAPGSGIGLTLVQRIVDQHGGSLAIESKIAHGTKITVTLPIETASAGKQHGDHLVH